MNKYVQSASNLQINSIFFLASHTKLLLYYQQMFSITIPKFQKKKNKLFSFLKPIFLCSLLTTLPQNQPLKHFYQTLHCQESPKNTKQNQSYSTILTAITQMHTSNLLEPLTYNKLHKFISTKEEQYLSTNYFSIVFCL